MLAKLKTTAAAGLMSLALVGSFAMSASAQEAISEAHLKAARSAVESTRSIEGFDNILPDVAERTRTLFVRNEPALGKEIDEAVTDVALKMAARRPELNKVIYEVWARRFSEQELNQIADFYNTEAGKKLAAIGGQLQALSIGAAKQWGDAIGRDMVVLVREELAKKAAQ